MTTEEAQSSASEDTGKAGRAVLAVGALAGVKDITADCQNALAGG